MSLRRVHYSDVLRGSAALAGMSLSDVSDIDFALFRQFHDRRLQAAWEIHRWPEICPIEQRTFRKPWDENTIYGTADIDTTDNSDNEVYDVPTGKYFQSLIVGNIGNPPTINGVENSDFWAECKTGYTANDFVSTATYTLGAQVRNPDNQQYYQRVSGLIISAAGTGDVNGNWTHNTTLNGRPQYVNTVTHQPMSWNGSVWRIYSLSVSGVAYQSTDNVATPDLVTTWTPVLGSPGSPVFDAVGTIDDAVMWGLLTPFQRFIAWEQWTLTPIGEFLRATDKDPRLTTKLVSLPFELSQQGAHFTQLKHTFAFVWLKFRIRRPELTGEVYDPTAVYTSGRQVYFTDSGGTGDFYTANTTAAAGESPESAPAKWDVVELPYTFRGYLIEAGYSDWLVSDGQDSKATKHESLALGYLELEADKLQRQQGQVERFNINA